ncbi:ABC transporter [Bacillaceae bacterium SAS-127]|nr:ABC transporter [Bacillaceae bacterium SAS-127]
MKKRNNYSMFQVSFFIVFLFTIIFMALIFSGLFFSGLSASFVTIIQDPEFQFALSFTLWTTVLATTIATFVSIPTSYVLSRREFKGKALAEALIDIPIVLPPLVSGIALLTFFGPLFGESLKQMGIEVAFSKWGVVVAQTFIATPFAIRAFKQAFDGIDTRYEHIARTLGYTPTLVFWKVTLPMAKGGLINGITMAWARTLGEFGATAMLAGVTLMKTETLSVAIFLKMSIGDFDFAIAISIIMLLVALTVLYVVKFTMRGERSA